MNDAQLMQQMQEQPAPHANRKRNRTPLPPAPQLEAPCLDNKSGRTCPLMLQAIDEATAEQVSELDALIKELEGMKEHLITSADRVKDQVSRHFALGTEAIGFRKRVVARLAEVLNTPAESQTTNG